MASYTGRRRLQKPSFSRFLHGGRSWIAKQFSLTESADYQAWRHSFMLDRLRLCLWIAVLCFLTFLVSDIYVLFIAPERFDAEVERIFGDELLAEQIRLLTATSSLVMGVLLTACVVLFRTKWGRGHLSWIFLFLCWSITLSSQVVGTLFHLPESNLLVWVLVFLAQAILIPVRWNLHLTAQVVTLAYYVSVNPLLGLTEIRGQSVYHPTQFIYIFWVYLICDLGVYLYEQLKRSEFESQRQLRIFLHSVSHDLRSPVIGTSMVLKGLLDRSKEQVIIDRAILERLIQGNERQLTLINSLLEAHSSEIQQLTLHCEPASLHHIIDSVLSDLEPTLQNNHIEVINHVNGDLPLIHVDVNQIWRVYCNLIANAVKHNPHGIQLILKASVMTIERDDQSLTQKPLISSSFTPDAEPTPILYCTVQDTGIGIDPAQSQRLFDLYTRGSRARYMPGLGLGLYLCKQIVAAHGGRIGVSSQPGKGATFWFMLPLHLSA
ncbi:hypothetical protein C7B76_31745 [filamentous cyanobacterium CCP2]|nr:hypothetical protein C7B76_31745 [filamentous cyanobacterium CCP2]